MTQRYREQSKGKSRKLERESADGASSSCVFVKEGDKSTELLYFNGFKYQLSFFSFSDFSCGIISKSREELPRCLNPDSFARTLIFMWSTRPQRRAILLENETSALFSGLLSHLPPTSISSSFSKHK